MTTFTEQVTQEVRSLEKKAQELVARVLPLVGKNTVKKLIESKTSTTLLKDTALTSSGVLDFSAAEERFFRLPPVWLKLVGRFLHDLIAALEDLEREYAGKGEEARLIPLPAETEMKLASIGMEDLAKKGEIVGFETKLASKNGRKKTVSISASALKDTAGTIQGMVITAKDMSDIQRLAGSLQILQELDKTKSEFVSIAAHQLRTPLTGIKWTMNSLLEEHVGKLNATQRKIAGDAYDAVLRLVELVNDLLDVARLEEGRFGFQFAEQALEPVLQKVFEKFRKGAEEKGVTFSLALPKYSLPSMKFDAEKVGIVLDNLVDNAMKYTSPGGQVTLRVAKHKDSVVIEVKDTGIGIPADQLQRVFTKFFRAENAQMFQTSGTGLGLYVTKSIIEKHKGTISFTSKEGKGTIFSISFPISSKYRTEKQQEKRYK